MDLVNWYLSVSHLIIFRDGEMMKNLLVIALAESKVNYICPLLNFLFFPFQQKYANQQLYKSISMLYKCLQLNTTSYHIGSI